MNQKGFATFEAILAVTIISVLAFIAVPKIDRVIDKIALDYEMKRLCSEIEFASSLNRSAGFDSEIFYDTISVAENAIILEINTSTNSWQIRRNEKFLRDRHYLLAGIKIFCNSDSVKNIEFTPEGRCRGDGTITLTSRHGEQAEIVFDTVGRWRGNRNVEY